MKKILLLLFFGGIFSAASAQRVYDTATVDLMVEMDSVQAVISAAEQISFNATYYMEDVDSITVYDTVAAAYQIKGEKFRILMDSIESVQNDMFTGTMYYADSMIIVQKPSSMINRVFQADLTDSLFQLMGMSSITAADSGLYRKITVQFDSSAKYTNYEVVFVKSNNYLVYIRYSLRKDIDPDSPNRINVKVSFSGIDATDFSDTVFSTDSYFKVINSQEVIADGTYTSGFEVINLIQN